MPVPPDSTAAEPPTDAPGEAGDATGRPVDHAGDATPPHDAAATGASVPSPGDEAPAEAEDDGIASEDRDDAARTHEAAEPADATAETPAAALPPDRGEAAEPPPADPALFAHALRIAEALVFASDRPVTPARLQSALPPDCEARAVLTALAASCADRRGFPGAAWRRPGASKGPARRVDGVGRVQAGAGALRPSQRRA